MMTLADVAARNGALLVEDVPGISWRIVDAGVKEKARTSPLQRSGFCEEDEDDEEDGAKKYLCWTCGAAYETGRAMEFLKHIMKCCKDESSKKAASRQSIMPAVTGEL
jgi:hypothetical protein